jgi:SNF2 family DNA or RNA helicase
VKKLILHPYLLKDTPLEKKRDIGFITVEEEALLEKHESEARKNEEAFLGVSTRRARACSTAKPKETKQIIEKKQYEMSPSEKQEKLKRRKLFDQFGMAKLLSELSRMHDKTDVKALVSVSVKTKFLLRLMANLKSEGHRVLVFSMSKKMLDLLETILADHSHSYLRIDGDTEIASRE